MPVRCGLCGGTHADARGVRECWQARGGAAADPGPSLADEWDTDPEAIPAPPTTPAPAGPPPRALQGSLSRAAVDILGRSVMVLPGADVPRAWDSRERVRVDQGVTRDTIRHLRDAWLARRPVVLETPADWEPDAGEIERSPVWTLDPGFEFAGERLAGALSNAVDARGAFPVWRWAAEAAGAGADPEGPADVRLPNGKAAFIDGGPLGLVDRERLSEAALLHRTMVEHDRLLPYTWNPPQADLAPDQLAAVGHPGGSASVIAPAGSGKTRVLTERARHLLRNWNLPPGAVCLVAFNKRAADEMVRRTADISALQIRTLNALGLSVAGGSGRFGTNRSMATIAETEVRNILSDLVRFPRRANTDPAAAWIEAFSAVRLGLRSPAQVEAEFMGDVDGLEEVFERYRTVLAQKGVVDFDEQIYRAIEILLTNPVARARARHACRVMLVDEFQDLTPAHLLLIRLLNGPGGAVYGVGDDDQTIYGYSGASPRWLIDFESYFPGASRHLLEVNYRCPTSVAAAAGTLLTHNRLRIDKAIAGGGREGAGLRTEVAADPVDATCSAVQVLLQDGAAATSVAVLTRVNSSLAPVQLSLAHAGIPVNRAVDARFTERSGVRAALAWLAIASKPSHLQAGDVALSARRPPRSLSPRVVEWMAEQRSVDRLYALAERLGDRDAFKVSGYAGDVEKLAQMAREGDSADILRCLRDDVGLAAAMAALDSEHRRLDRSPQTDDLDALIAIAKLHPDPEGFGAWLREALSRPGDPEGVTLATIHSVKGREWDHVVVHDATEGLMPHRLAADLEEERRVFHVGITRCRESCLVVAGQAASPFVEQLTREWDPSVDAVIAQPAPALPAPEAAAGGPGVDELFDVLREWRREKARSEGRPAYTVLHDSTLRAIAASGAATLADLARIKGVGPAKLSAFGDEILAVLDA